jgi:hypothetical protein
LLVIAAALTQKAAFTVVILDKNRTKEEVFPGWGGLPAEANKKENRSVLAGELPRGPRRFHHGNKEAAGLRASAGHVVNFDILQSFGWYFVATELEMNSQATEYLTEASLGRFLRERVDPAIVAGQLIPGISRRYQPDFRMENAPLIVEFDGDEHYRSAKRSWGMRNAIEHWRPLALVLFASLILCSSRAWWSQLCLARLLCITEIFW